VLEFERRFPDSASSLALRAMRSKYTNKLRNTSFVMGQYLRIRTRYACKEMGGMFRPWNAKTLALNLFSGVVPCSCMPKMSWSYDSVWSKSLASTIFCSNDESMRRRSWVGCSAMFRCSRSSEGRAGLFPAWKLPENPPGAAV